MVLCNAFQGRAIVSHETRLPDRAVNRTLRSLLTQPVHRLTCGSQAPPISREVLPATACAVTPLPIA